MVDAMQENKEVHQVVNTENNKKSLTKWLVAIGFIFLLVVLITIKVQVDSFVWSYFFIILAFLVVIFFILFFGFGIFKKFNENKEKIKAEDKLPPVASKEQLKKECEKILSSEEYENHVKQYLNIIPKFINKNLIYDFEIIPLYNDKTNKDIIHLIFNAHYIDRYPAILFNPSPQKINEAMNAMSTNPNPDAEVERRTEVDLLTGKEVSYEKKTPGKLNEKKDEPKKEIA